jgi:hypothetical protein
VILLCREIGASEEWSGQDLGGFGAVRVVRQVCVGDGVGSWPALVLECVPDEVLPRAQAAHG